MQTVWLFVNPVAGRGRATEIAARVSQRLMRDRYDVQIFDRPAHLIDLPSDPREVAAVIVIGGDGTLRAVAQRLVDTLRDNLVPLLLVPLGTANLMARHLHTHWQDETLPDEVAAALAGRRILRLDAARANGRLLLLMAGVGIDAYIVHELDRARRGPIDVSSYILPTVLALQAYTYSPLEVLVDQRRVFGPAEAMAFVGNVREYGTGFPVLPLAVSNDGLLDVCVLPCRSREQLFTLFLHAATGEHLDAPGVVYTRGRSVRVRSDFPIPVQIDGDAAGHTPLDVDLLPVKIPFIVT